MSSIQRGTPYIFVKLTLHVCLNILCLSPVQLKPMGILIGKKYCKSKLNLLECKASR
jgi:hypothetical protein